jgi:hypothetical protein
VTAAVLRASLEAAREGPPEIAPLKDFIEP